MGPCQSIPKRVHDENFTMASILPSLNENIINQRTRVFDHVPANRFDPTTNFNDNMNVDDDSTEMSDATEAVLMAALGKLTLIDETSMSSKTLIKCLNRIVIEPNEKVIVEGDATGDKLYCVASGALEVTIKGKFIRTLEQGAAFGELALLFDIPRSATVIAETICELWTLDRQTFRAARKQSAQRSADMKCGLFHNCTELAALNQYKLSKLVDNLAARIYKSGDFVFTEDAAINRFILIEAGFAVVYVPPRIQALPPSEWDEMLGIARPSGAAYSDAEASANYILTLPSFEEISSEITILTKGIPYPTTIPDDNMLMYRIAGCIMGLGMLRGKAGLPNGWEWREESPKIGTARVSTCLSICSVEAVGELEVSFMTISSFERLFGPYNSETFNKSAYNDSFKEAVGNEMPGREASFTTKIKLTDLSPSKFDLVHDLGRGAMGPIILARFNVAGEFQGSLCALKVFSKQGVINARQIEHVLEERRNLLALDSSFIVRAVGCYQTPELLILVNESLLNGDLWMLLHDRRTKRNEGGLPGSYIRFYITCVIFALQHMHSKGIAFRNMKPENIMFTSSGYVKLIGFGFSKKFPFLDVASKSYQYKSFTICGTAEYMAPEIVLGSGHDEKVDFWSLGVLIHELATRETPFGGGKQSVPSILTAIAGSNKSGIHLRNEDLNSRGDAVELMSLIARLLKYNPADRYGTGTIGGISELFRLPYFHGYDMERVQARLYKPPYEPPLKISTGNETLSIEPTYHKSFIQQHNKLEENDLNDHISINGDHSIFSEWSSL